MNSKDLKPADHFARCFGVKALVYGRAGSAKTPSIATAPRPLLLATEPGLGSLRGVQNVATYMAHTPEKVDEFFKWFFSGASDVKNYDTLAIDSLSQLFYLILEKAKTKTSHGMKAYGILDEEGYDLATKLYYMQEKHMYLISQYGTMEENGVVVSRPMFEGQALNRKIPHLFDQILYLSRVTVAGHPNGIIGMRARATPDIMARDRYGKLDEIEWPDTPDGLPNLTKIFSKVMYG